MTKRKPINEKARWHILERDGFACRYCGARAPNVTLHIDHIVPVAKGGENDPTNLGAVCIACNLGKRDSMLKAVYPPPPIAFPIRVSDDVVICHGEPLTEPVFWIGRQWAVTAFGIECRDGSYPIESSRLWEVDNFPGQIGWHWGKHMEQKSWIDANDFYNAFIFARGYFKHLAPKDAAQFRGIDF